MTNGVKARVLWSGVYKTTSVRIVEVVHPDTVIDGESGRETIPGMISRMVEMSTAQDVLGGKIWFLTEFDADMLLFFLTIRPSDVQPITGQIGMAATVAADRPMSAAVVSPEP